jgi:uncharacterized surface protein with fasciclin (FAS1) repeats
MAHDRARRCPVRAPERRDALAASLERHLPILQLDVPAGGMAFWARAPDELDLDEAVQRMARAHRDLKTPIPTRHDQAIVRLGPCRQPGMPNLRPLIFGVLVVLIAACDKKQEQQPPTATATPATAPSPPPLDPKNIVSIAIASKDHATLIAALKAADYVTSIANPGPLTVFAPTDAAFAKLPAGTVESLVKPENQAKLKEILKYHVTTSVYEQTNLTDGQVLGMANGGKATIHIKDGKLSINDANVIASVRASNGVVHVIDSVLTPP